jgi:hypothetical protein
LAGMIGVVQIAWVGSCGQSTVFKSESEVVPAYATVRDHHGQLVLKLDKQDFELRGDGQIVAISTFSNTVQPLSVTLLLDRSSSMAPFPLVTAAAEVFIRSLLPGDHAAVNTLDSTSEALTDDQSRLEHAARHGIAVYVVGFGPTLNVTINGTATDPWRRRAAEIQSGIERPVAGSGGDLLLPATNDGIQSTFERLSKELHHQYLLGFIPRSFGGKSHKITVRAKGAEMKVHARTTCLAPSPGRRVPASRP